MTGPRQQLLYLWLGEGSLDNEVVAWAFYDGTGGSGPALPDAEAPYTTGMEALLDGWFLLQSPPPPPVGGAAGQLAYLDHEFVFERRID